MLQFREHRWLLDPGASRFDAYIGSKTLLPKDVSWTLGVHYVAGGAIWRRVSGVDRPSFEVKVHGFSPGLRSWKGLERLDLWELPDDDDEDEDEEFPRPDEPDFGNSYLEAYYSEGGLGSEWKELETDYMWRVVSREGALFTVEVAGFADAEEIRGALMETELVAPDGGKAPGPRPEAAFWKECAEFYLLETVAFGTVTARVPRNAGDVEAYAMARARHLLDVPEPEHIDVIDFNHPPGGKVRESPLGDDLHVKLHFNSRWNSK